MVLWPTVMQLINILNFIDCNLLKSNYREIDTVIFKSRLVD